MPRFPSFPFTYIKTKKKTQNGSNQNKLPGRRHSIYSGGDWGVTPDWLSCSIRVRLLEFCGKFVAVEETVGLATY